MESLLSTDLTFPKDFIFGAGSASYQVEGNYQGKYKKDDVGCKKGASIWDTFTGSDCAGMIGGLDSSGVAINKTMFDNGTAGVTGENAVEFKENVDKILDGTKFEHLRISISWPRVVPSGIITHDIHQTAEANNFTKLCKKVDYNYRENNNNPYGYSIEGSEYYVELINKIFEQGNIKSLLVTLYHWDLPQFLLTAKKKYAVEETADSIQGWYAMDGSGCPSGYKSICVNQFAMYSAFIIHYLKKRLSNKIFNSLQFTSFNEPWTFLMLGSGGGKAPNLAPYQCAEWPPYQDKTNGDVIVAGTYNVVVAHALANTLVNSIIDGNITLSIVLNCDATVTKDFNKDRYSDQLDTFANPVYGVNKYQFPENLNTYGDNKFKFTGKDLEILMKSKKISKDTPFCLNTYGCSVSFDSDVEIFTPESSWLNMAAGGLFDLLNYVHSKYCDQDRDIYITEFGCSDLPLRESQGVYDPIRVLYYYQYLAMFSILRPFFSLKAIYFWSICDNFEWERGYSERFGLKFVEFKEPENVIGPYKRPIMDSDEEGWCYDNVNNAYNTKVNAFHNRKSLEFINDIIDNENRFPRDISKYIVSGVSKNDLPIFKSFFSTSPDYLTKLKIMRIVIQRLLLEKIGFQTLP